MQDDRQSYEYKVNELNDFNVNHTTKKNHKIC